VRADAIDRQQPQREEQPVAEILDPEQIRESLEKTIHAASL
jgi:hypothetical protein